MQKVLFFLQIFLKISSSNDDQGIYSGDIWLGGLFPMHGRDQHGDCDEKAFEIDGIFSLEAFYYSLDLMNQDLMNCCGFKVGAVTLDTCQSDSRGLLQALKFVVHRLPDLVNDDDIASLTGKRGLDIIGVVGPMGSGVTVQVANLLGMFKIPQISYAATTPVLSNPSRYPYFMRTVPSDFEQASALVRVLKHFNWSYAIGVYEDSSYGLRGFQVFSKLATQKGICFAGLWKIDVDNPISRDPEYYEEKILGFFQNKHKAKALVLYLSANFAHRIFVTINKLNLKNHFIIIGTDGWGSRYLPPNLNEVVDGAITTHPVHKHFPGFSEYFLSLNPRNVDKNKNPWFNEYWKVLFDCDAETSKICAGKDPSADKIDGTEFGYMHFVRDAVFAYGEALKSMYHQKCGHINREGICNLMKLELKDTDSPMLIHLLKNSSFKGVDDVEVKFVNGNVDGAPIFSVMKYGKNNATGRYFWNDIASISVESDGDVLWKNGAAIFDTDFSYPNSVCGVPCGPAERRKYNKDKCCWSCVECEFPTYKYNESNCESCYDKSRNEPPFLQPNKHKNACETVPVYVVGLNDPFIIAVASFAALGLLLTVITLGLFIYYANTPIIKASSRELSTVLLVGLILCYGNVFLVSLEPNVYSCASARFLYSVSYTVCYAAVFIKTNRIARIFGVNKNSKTPRKIRYISPMSQLLLSGLIVGFQCILSTVWLILRAPKRDYSVDLNREDKKILVYHFCEAFEDEDMIIALVIPLILILLSALYAFKARKCPGKFNETKYIVITTYTTCVVWFAFILVFFTTEKIPVRIFALCAGQALNATVTLLCLFFPKLYVALCRPHKNTKEVVMGKKSENSMGSWMSRKLSVGNGPNFKEPSNSRRTVTSSSQKSDDEYSETTIRNPNAARKLSAEKIEPVFEEEYSYSSSNSSDDEVSTTRERTERSEKRLLSKARKGRNEKKKRKDSENKDIKLADESD